MKLVYDLGGTSLRAARIDGRPGTVTARTKIETPTNISALARSMKHGGRQVMGGEVPEVIGVALPGPIAPKQMLCSLPTVSPGGELVDLEFLRELQNFWTGVGIHLLNDVAAAGFFFVEQGYPDFVIVNVGSGIGHKLFLGGRSVVGPNFRGGEIGHLVVDRSPHAPVCDCGGIGHLGAISSGRGTVRFIREKAALDSGDYRRSVLSEFSIEASMIDAADIAEAFRCRDPWTTLQIESAAGPLGQALAAMHLITGVEDLLIVGGFATALGEPYRRILVDIATRSCWQSGADWDRMVHLTSANDDCALLGTALAIERDQTTCVF